MVKFDGVDQALTVVDTRPSGDCLVTAVSCSASLDQHLLRDHCQELLPSYMVPSEFVFLESMPTNANGKIDRKAVQSLIDRKSQVTNSRSG